MVVVQMDGVLEENGCKDDDDDEMNEGVYGHSYCYYCCCCCCYNGVDYFVFVNLSLIHI